jgi:hypothetical protein
MRALLVAVVIAGALTVAVYPSLPGIIRPPICHTVSQNGVVQGTYCATWDWQAGRYIIPRGLPCDVARFSSGRRATPDEFATLIFIGTTAVLWAVFAVAQAVVAKDGRSRSRRVAMQMLLALASIGIVVIAGRLIMTWSIRRGAFWDTAFLVACVVMVSVFAFARLALALRPSARV